MLRVSPLSFQRFPHPARSARADWRRGGAAVLLLALAAVLAAWTAGAPRPAAAQAPLFLVNENTTVDGIRFRFTGSETFETDRLKEQIALQEPSFFDAVKGPLPFLEPNRYPFDPVVLQKDVARLKSFYGRNGFLQARIDYVQDEGPTTRLDTTDNEIRVVFIIDEGPPLIIQDVSFLSAADSSSYAVSLFEGELREEWIRFRDRTSFKTGERYNDFNRLRIEDEVLNWLQNRGFAFAQIGTGGEVDSTYNTADIRFFIDPGPRARIGEIDVEGNESVAASVVRRELPFRVGERFSQNELAQGQRSVFGLNLFRLALVDVPPQERDSTVAVRVRVREAALRYVSAQTGYARTLGLTTEGGWTHRNFLGAARTFSVNALANTGFFAAEGDRFAASRLFRGSLSLRQPYLFRRSLSGVVSPFIQYEQNPLLPPSPGEPLGINAREFGLNTTLIYELLPFRTLVLQHTFTRALTFGTGTADIDPDMGGFIGGSNPRDVYSRSVISANATIGNVDDFLNPSAGFLVRPLAEVGGGFLGSGVEYAKVSNEVVGYLPLGERVGLAGRLFAGRLWPFGRSEASLDGLRTPDDSLRFENRFDPIVFYNGGSSDLRGWRDRLAGAKVAQRFLFDNDFTDDVPPDTTIEYEAVGGRAKLAFNAEARLPFPGLGPSWATAVFLDAGQSTDRLGVGDMRFGTGAGLRYRTPVGFLRVDLGYKLNPTFEDLRDPEDVFRFRNGLTDEPPEANPWRRFHIHLSIGQTF